MNRLVLTSLASVTLLVSLQSVAHIHSLQPVGRYLTVNTTPSHAQIDLLSQIIQVRFPSTVQTIGDAMQYLLRFSGYSLIGDDQMNLAFKTTLTKPLPAIDRNFGPMSLKDALTTLAGPAFTLAHDPINRTINFQLKPRFKHSAHRIFHPHSVN